MVDSLNPPTKISCLLLAAARLGEMTGSHGVQQGPTLVVWVWVWWFSDFHTVFDRWMADFHGGTRGWFGKQELCHLSCMFKSYVIDSVDLFAKRAQPFASLYSNLIERLGNYLKVRALAFKTSSHSPYGARLSSCKFVLRRAALCVTCGFVGTCPMYWLYLMVRRELSMGIHIFQFSTGELITCCLFLSFHCYVPCTWKYICLCWSVPEGENVSSSNQLSPG